MKEKTEFFLSKCKEVNDRLNEAAKNQKENLGDLKKLIDEKKKEKKKLTAELKALSKQYHSNEYRKAFQQVQNEYMFLCDDLMNYMESLDDQKEKDYIDGYLKDIGFSYRRHVNPKQYNHQDRKKAFDQDKMREKYDKDYKHKPKKNNTKKKDSNK